MLKGLPIFVYYTKNKKCRMKSELKKLYILQIITKKQQEAYDLTLNY